MKQPIVVCTLSELEPDRGHRVIVNGRRLALFLHDAEIYALEDRCPHREGQLSRGHVSNGEAICPLHGWNFDLKTGVSPYNPNDRITTYPCEVRDDQVVVDGAAVSPLPEASFEGYQGEWRRWDQAARGHALVRRLAKVALARGASQADTLTCSGEGGMLPEERQAADHYIFEMASGYFGWRPENIRLADAIEIKLGQSAKPGLGGELPGNKVNPEIARVRGIEPGTAAHSPARFADIGQSEELAARIDEIRQLTNGQSPVGIKFAANDVAADTRAALALMPDFITLDGFGGGTGAAPSDVRGNFGMPLVAALPIARRLIESHNAAHPERPVSLIATGGVRTPTDIIKALALGADACALATASLFALGCEYYRACGSNECPVGITTQKPALRERIDMDKGAERVANFFNGTRQALESYLRIMGLAYAHQLSQDELIPLSGEAERILASV